MNMSEPTLSTRGPHAPEARPPWTGTVRAMTPRDVDAVAALEAVCNPQPWTREALWSFVPSAIGVVALDDATVVGYALATVVRDESELLVLGVSPERRRQGIAAALLKETLTQVRRAGAKAVFLEVRQGNKPAIGLYRNFGFGEAGVRKGYYADTGEDALLMHAFVRG
ncbi:MAG TPA: ribosomal protein S18-alanine N-acetyltransferase [Fibrobacteria bacterium]|nr:ribosomal protein S18-alanine N-acetyltransferase [Fibrobacteria bacterium]